MQPQPKTQNYVTQITQLAQDLNIKHRQIVKQLVQIINKLNEIIPPIEYEGTEIITTSCWQDGNVYRCHKCRWGIKVGSDGKPEIVLWCNTSYSGQRDWVEDPVEDLEAYKKMKNYRAIHNLAKAFVRFLKDYLAYLEQKQQQLEGVIADLNIIIRVIKK